MAIINPSTGGKAPQIDDDIYHVVCLHITEINLETPDQFGKTAKLDFHIQLVDKVDAEGEPVMLDPRCNRAWSENATLFKWAQAFGLDPDPLKPIDTEQFHGMEARADIRTESEGKWPRVISFMPMPKKNGSKPGPMSTDQDPDFDGFWKRIKSGGFERKEVAPYVDGDLTTVAMKTQNELNKILSEMGA